MGSHKSKENGYMQMGARLYNSETGRFMSVDPLMEIFTGHSPYHYSYNNPVMFSDPSGLAPEGEKNSKVQAPGDDIIGSSHTNGYWATKRVWIGRMSIVNPLDPTTHKIYEDGLDWVWNESSSGGASGSSIVGMITPSGGGMKSGGRTSTKSQTTSLSKSMRDQNYLSSLKLDGFNFYSDEEFDDFNHIFDYKFISLTKDFVSYDDLNRTRKDYDYNGSMLIDEFKKLINFATKNNATFLFIATQTPLLYDEKKQNLIEHKSLKWNSKFAAQFFGNGTSVYVINYNITILSDPTGKIFHEMTHWQMLNKYGIKGGHPEGLFYPYLDKLINYYQKIND